MTLPRPRLALSLLTLTLALSGCVNIPSSNGYGTRDDPRYGQLLDLINEALKADMAVVLVADLMPHASLKDLSLIHILAACQWESLGVGAA